MSHRTLSGNYPELRSSDPIAFRQASIPDYEEVRELRVLVKQAQSMVPDTERSTQPRAVDSDDELDSGSDTASDESTRDMCKEIGFNTKCMTELGPVLEQNLTRARQAYVQPSELPPLRFLLSDPAKIYVSLVRDKFKQAQDQLVNRLGESNWQRHISVRKKTENVESASVGKLGMDCSTFRPYSAFHDSGLGTSVPAQTTYAPSHTSFQSSKSERAQGSLQVPSTPVEIVDGKPFQCYLCGHLVSKIKNRVDWKWVPPTAHPPLYADLTGN